MWTLILALTLACSGAGADCGNVVDVACNDNGTDCSCAKGPETGTACDLDADSPDFCDDVCSFCEMEQAGPPSVLLGTK